MRNVILVGNPNTGKTTLFNLITKSSEHVGNWQGVTVEYKSKKVSHNNQDFLVTDLPGTYSLLPFSDEEKVTRAFVFEHQKERIINIVDGDNLNRNLLLTLQLIEADFNVVLALNQTTKKCEIDINILQKEMGITIQKVDIKNKKLSKDLLFVKTSVGHLSYKNDEKLQKIGQILCENAKKTNKTPFFCAIKVMEQDEFWLKKINITQDQEKQIKQVLQDIDSVEYITKLRFSYIDFLTKKAVVKKQVFAKSKLDNFILNRWLVFPIFFALFALVFFITFSSFGLYISNFLKNMISLIFSPLINWLSPKAPSWVVDLLSTVLIGGVGGLISFLPQIAILFFFLNLLEDSGYMSRIAFSFEDILGKIGLNGKSIFCLLMGFGCSTSAVLTSRNLEGNSRIKTAMVTPIMTCSAKLPLFIILASTFFNGNFLIILFLYLLCIMVAVVASIILNKILPQEVSFMMEFAPYRRPSIISLLKKLYKNCKLFIARVGAVLIALSVIVWVLQSFSFDLSYITLSGKKSILQTCGEVFAFILKPIGLGNWGICACLLTGIIAKEMIVSSLAIINKVLLAGNFNKAVGLSLLSATSVISFSGIQAFIFMIFSLLYFPCLSTISVLKKEIGFKLTAFSLFLQFALAYGICLIIFGGYKLFMIFGIKAIFGLLGAIIIFLAFYWLLFKRKCGDCSKCSKHCEKK